MRRLNMVAFAAGWLLLSCSNGADRRLNPTPAREAPPATGMLESASVPDILRAHRSEAKAIGFPPVNRDPRAAVYEADATVLQYSAGPARLCVGVIGTSLPPVCGDVPVPNWSWDYVEGEFAVSGTTWGEYHVTGTFDGQNLTLVEAPGPRRPRSTPEPPPLGSACPTPNGGWTSPDPGLSSPTAQNAAVVLAQQSDDLAGIWIDHGPPGGPVLNLAFTGDLRRHEAELRAAWGGPLCLSTHPRPLSQLRTYQDEISKGAIPGLQMLAVGVDQARNQVTLDAVLIDEHIQKAMDARFGPDVVRARSALRPVS